MKQIKSNVNFDDDHFSIVNYIFYRQDIYVNYRKTGFKSIKLSK